MAEPVLEVVDLVRDYADEGHRAVDDLSFSVEQGEILALLGPSGCGKSTTLKCVAGLERPDGGTVRIEGKVMSSHDDRVWVTVDRRAVGFVFQSLALWPHLSVFENVAYPLKVRKTKRSEVRSRVMESLRLVRCEHLVDRRPSQISGGEQQRVALVRALVHEPSVVLFDEPFSAIDASLRHAMRQELLRIRDETGFTAIFVTHDQTEALNLGDRVAVMFDGRFSELGHPQELFEAPTTLRGARFLGSMNTISGVVTEIADGVARVDTPLGLLSGRAADDESSTIRVGAPALVGIRPHHLEVRMPGPDAIDPSWRQGVIAHAAFTGTTHVCQVTIGDRVLEVDVLAELGLDWATPGTEVVVRLPSSATRVYPAHVVPTEPTVATDDAMAEVT